MANPISGLFSRISWIFRVIFSHIGGILGFFYLFALSMFAILYAVVALTAIQVREDLKTAGGDQGSLSYDEVKNSRVRYDENSRLINEAIFNPKSDEIELLDELHKYRIEVKRLADGIYFWINDKAPPEDFEPTLFVEDSGFLQLLSQCREAETDVDFPEKTRFLQDCKDLTDYQSNLINFQRLNDRYQSNFGPEYLIARQADFRKKIEELRAAEPLYQYYSTLRFFEEDLKLFGFGGSFTWILTIPSEVLILFLTMAMGLLGSVVTMTWSYARQDNVLTLRRFLVLPFVGSISAFIVFIFISAGQLTLTAGADSGTLSPFVLSFIGIISGLLSERAYGRIAEVGGDFFRTGDDKPRWASRLRKSMDETGVPIGVLARHLGLSETEVTAIADESVTATFDQQRLIAACIRQPIRDIFTDVPPEGFARADTETSVTPETPATATMTAAAGPVPAGASMNAQDLVAVPDLFGLSEADADKALQMADLSLGATTRAEDDAAAAGTVLRQVPAASQMVPSGTAVDVVLSSGPAEPPGVG